MKFFSKVGSGLSAANAFFFPGSKEYPKVGAGKMLLLGLQHAFAMSCATILVPILTGLDVGVALFAAGLGTTFSTCAHGEDADSLQLVCLYRVSAGGSRHRAAVSRCTARRRRAFLTRLAASSALALSI